MLAFMNSWQELPLWIRKAIAFIAPLGISLVVLSAHPRLGFALGFPAGALAFYFVPPRERRGFWSLMLMVGAAVAIRFLVR